MAVSVAEGAPYVGAVAIGGESVVSVVVVLTGAASTVVDVDDVDEDGSCAGLSEPPQAAAHRAPVKRTILIGRPFRFVRAAFRSDAPRGASQKRAKASSGYAALL